MNNQTLLLLTLGIFMGLIVTVTAVNQYLLDKHPPTEVDGLLWRIETALDRVRDLEATVQITQEAFPGDTLRIKVLYVKGPPPTLSMRYLRPHEPSNAQFAASLRDETITVEGDLIRHQIPADNDILTKRWFGLPLASLGLGVFQVSPLRSEWTAGAIEIRILQPISGFNALAPLSPMTTMPSFTEIPNPLPEEFTVQAFAMAPQQPTCFSFCLEDPEEPEEPSTFNFCLEGPEEPSTYGLGLARALEIDSRSVAISRSYILEVRDAQTKDLVRMVWVDRQTYLVQRVVTFKHGERDATLLVQLITIDQGLTAEDIVMHPQA